MREKNMDVLEQSLTKAKLCNESLLQARSRRMDLLLAAAAVGTEN